MGVHVAPVFDVDAHWFLGFATVKPLPGYGNVKISSLSSIGGLLARLRSVIFDWLYDIGFVWTTQLISSSPN
jgi:hypothetical protein